MNRRAGSAANSMAIGSPWSPCRLSAVHTIASLAMLLGLWLVVLAPAARAEVNVLVPLWEKLTSLPEHSIETRSAAIDATGQVWIVGLQRPVALRRDRSRDQGWLGVFGPDGDLRWSRTFVLRRGDARVTEIDAIAPDGAGALLVAGQAENGDGVLVRLARDGQVSQLRETGRRRIATLLKAGNGDIVLGGREGRDLYALRMAANGEVVWEHTIDRGRDDLFLTALDVGSDSVVAMVENSGQREQFFLRDSRLGISLLDRAADSTVPRLALPGRGGALVRDGDGWGLLYDAANNVDQKPRFARLDARFDLLSEQELPPLKLALERSKLGRFGAGNFLAVMVDGGRLSAQRLDRQGKPVSVFTSAAGRFHLHPEVLGNADVYVVSTILTEEAGNQLRHSVHLIRFGDRTAP